MEKTAIELFAGVGGFRIGLNNVKLIDNKVIEDKIWNFVWFNQWEPSMKIQYAHECYSKRFKENFKDSNTSIFNVNKKLIPNHSLLLGGFPCQDYSVAHGNKAKGIKGKKGVLWWEINEILNIKNPPFVLLENVDRLLKSPSNQRGRDFGIILKCFYDNKYDVEWRIINGAEFGHPQKRKRVFIFAYKKSTNFYKENKKCDFKKYQENSVFKEFPIYLENEIISINLKNKENHTLNKITKNFIFDFKNLGWMHDGIIYTAKCKSNYYGKYKTLNEILENRELEEKYFLNKKQEILFKYLKGSKKIKRFKPDGSEYYYSEGSMHFPEKLENASRTIITSESSINRSTHIVNDKINKKNRFLTPIECERINEFPDNWTNTMPEKKRYFMMGNALICGIITKIGLRINEIIDNE